MALEQSCFDSLMSSSMSDAPDLKKLQALPLEDKIVYSKSKIGQFYTANKRKVYVSFSGGKDSTVLLHLVRSMYPKVKAVFYDTGLEFPEIRDFVKTFENVDIIRPELSFRKVIEKYGYPCIGKECANAISLAQRGKECGIRLMNDDGRFGYKKYNFLVDAPFKVSESCCYHLKKKPSHAYSKKTGLVPIIGTRAQESSLRATKFKKKGEETTGKNISLTPLSIWTSEDINKYIQKFDVKISEIYKMGYNRTGCMFCMFGIMFDKNRFVLLKKTHPKIWAYCMKPFDEGGLGLKDVLEFMDIPTGLNQSFLEIK